ncbi:MAG: isoleucine--tRNA ligase [Fimbriimonadaceae bacterium]
MNLKDTLNLPNAEFSIPMKADLTIREPIIQAKWDEMGIYELIQQDRKDAPSWVFHDGPPYTNSPIHIGTGLNKILKDFACRSHSMMGYRVPFVPGYDNHGLPIEQAVIKKLNEAKIEFDIPKLREECRKHAEHFINVQTTQFKRLGVLAMWDNSYSPMRPKYGAEIIRIFNRLVENGYIYRGLRPVLWSPTFQTALADTEIVYDEAHVSTSIYVKFPLLEDPNGLFAGLDDVGCVIWTTTPWTIPANLAVAFHPTFTYVVAKTDRGHLVLIKDLLEKTMEKCGITSYQVVKEFPGKEAEFIKFKHPIFDRESLAVLADYVTTEDGTGVVHTAPGHGRDDFMTGQKYGLPVLCPVDERGVLTAEAGEFEGVHFKKCDVVVTERLAETGNLLFTEPYTHKYPLAERDGKPVIFRTTEQWFIGIDLPFHADKTKTLRQAMLEQIPQVSWYPPPAKGRFTSMIEGRPDWCISRQRPWGIGIPIFYGKESGKPVLDSVAIEAIAAHIEQNGSDSWYTAEPSEILPNGYKHPETGETDFIKETDVFDVWFDSACTHLCVLEGNVDPSWKEHLPADLFLEGSDQHRGWFNISMFLGMAARGGRPFNAVVTHGMITDATGDKMSKRKGNTVDPVNASNEYGADVLRYWAASVNYHNDAPVSHELLKIAGDNYRSIRNSLRFLLGNLADYHPEEPAVLSKIDQWIMQSADQLVEEVTNHFKVYDFLQALSAIHNFGVNELSRFYLDAIKDVVYADATNSPKRRGAQQACHYVLVRLTMLISPILIHTSEETYERIPHIDHKQSVHMDIFPKAVVEFDGQLNHQVEVLMAVRARTFAQWEQEKAGLGLKNSQDVEVDLQLTAEEHTVLSVFPDLDNLFKMAAVRISEGEPKATFTKSEFLECARSRVRRQDVHVVTLDGEQVPLSRRDREVLGIN